MGDWRGRVAIMLRWLGLGAVVGALAGAASALFLELLDRATKLRGAEPRLIWALPIAGLILGFAWERFGEPIKRGNDLVIDTVHSGGAVLPLRMAPMVLLGTVLTHLFGGSAGREGTAVQMGASLADGLAERLQLSPLHRRELLLAGVAGGFGAVFGTPFAGAVFALEVVVAGRVDQAAFPPALVAALVGDFVTRSLGIVHTPYPVLATEALTPLLAGKWVVFAFVVAAVTIAFIELTHFLKRTAERLIPRRPWRMAAGGALVVLLSLPVGADYLGLGVPTIIRAFTDPTLPSWSFAAKLVLTAVTLGAGFVGGEVTPLFFVGATLGNAAAPILDVPLPLIVGVGLAGVFGAAARTPLALSIMAVEIFGAGVLPHVALVAILAAWISGERSIYAAQKSR